MRNYKGANEILDLFEQQIQRLKKEFNDLKDSDFINALEKLKTFADQEYRQHSFFDVWVKNKKNWPLSLVEELTQILAKTNLQNHTTQIAEILTLCHAYQSKPISHPWAKLIAIILLASLGLLLGLSLGTMTGWLTLSLLITFIATCALGELAMIALPLPAAIFIGIGLAFGSMVWGSTWGSAGALTGGYLGLDAGEYLTHASLCDLSNLLFYHEESQMLSEQAFALSTAAEFLQL